jgi:hypothetical protein
MKLPIFSDSFIEFLNNIKKESRIARLIISVIQMHNDGFKNMLPRVLTNDNVNYITYRSDGNISFLPTGKEHIVNDDNTWSRTNRQSGKPARIMRKLFTDKMLSLLNEQDFEIFNNYYKCKFNTTGYRLELLDNIQITEVYDMTLESGSSSLNNSCMNGKSDYLDIYTHCKNLKILALFNQNHHLAGRALVWTIIDEEIDGSEIILMDRVYVTQDYLYDLFIEHATSNKWWYKQDYKSMHNKTAFINSEGNVLYRKFKIYTDTEFDTYPYIDTFQYGDDGFLTNKGNYQYEYCETGGTRSGGDVYDEINDEHISEDDAVTIERGEYAGQRTHIDNTVLVNDNYYWKESEDICIVDGDYYLKEDCVYSDYDDEYYLEDDCVYSEYHSTHILISDAYEVNGNYYHQDIVNKL